MSPGDGITWPDANGEYSLVGLSPPGELREAIASAFEPATPQGGLEDLFPDELGGAALPYFVDWLVENVHLVEITAYSDEDAYTIFETMNDRGLSLTPADMLKGYLLANITDVDHRTRASGAWKERVRALAEIGKDEDADGIKSWLRSWSPDRLAQEAAS